MNIFKSTLFHSYVLMSTFFPLFPCVDIEPRDLNNVSVIRATLKSVDNILHEERIIVQIVHGFSLDDGLKRILYSS